MFISTPFRAFMAVLVLLFAVAAIEASICVAVAVRFSIREITTYRDCFISNYNISTRRDKVTRAESRHNWLLWMSVLTGGIKISYSQMQKNQAKEYAAGSIANAMRFALLFLAAPLHIVCSAASVFERGCRCVLSLIAFPVFCLLYYIKARLSFHLNSFIVSIDSKDYNPECSDEVLYRKPAFKITLCNPDICPDFAQKDNLNYFTVSLKNIRPQINRVKFRTTVYYPGGRSAMESELPMTASFLEMSFEKISFVAME